MFRPANTRGSCITGLTRWAGLIGLRNAFNTAKQSDADLQAHKEPEGRSPIAWSYETQKHLSGISESRSTTRWRFPSNRKLTVPKYGIVRKHHCRVVTKYGSARHVG